MHDLLTRYNMDNCQQVAGLSWPLDYIDFFALESKKGRKKVTLL